MVLKNLTHLELLRRFSKISLFFLILPFKKLNIIPGLSFDKIRPHQWRSGNAQNWNTGGARFNPQSRFLTYPFRVFHGFLRNLCKYGLGSLRKTPTEGTPNIVPDPTSRQLDSILQPTNPQAIPEFKLFSAIYIFFLNSRYFSKAQIEHLAIDFTFGMTLKSSNIYHKNIQK